MIVFSQQLKSIRREKHLSQDDLANQLFISRQSISKWENGEAMPDLENLVRLAEILHVSLDELVKGEKIETVDQPDQGDPLSLFLNFLSENWWLIFFLPIIASFIKLFLNLF